MRIRPRYAVSLAVLIATAAAVIAALPSTASINPLSGALADAVATTMLKEHGALARAEYGVTTLTNPLVERKRSAGGGWAFGTVVIPVPRGGVTEHAGPEAALFVARRTLAGWRIALDGTSDFVRLARQAPTGVVSAEEKRLFADNRRAALRLPKLPLPTLFPGRPSTSPSTSPGGDPSASPGDPSASPTETPGDPTETPGNPTPRPTDTTSSPAPSPSDTTSPSPTATPSPSQTTQPGQKTGLMLPFAVSESWWMGGGPHGNGGKRPFSSLDFGGSGDSGKVRAAADGRMYRFCSDNRSLGLIRVIHSNGYSTDYYHMTDTHTGVDGTTVKRGDYLGHIGTELPCGGRASGDHVHFALRKKNEPVAVNGLMIGGWTFHEGREAYEGYAERNGKRAEVRTRITNYGPS